MALANGTEGTRSELHNTPQFYRYGNGFWSIWVVITPTISNAPSHVSVITRERRA